MSDQSLREKVTSAWAAKLAEARTARDEAERVGNKDEEARQDGLVQESYWAFMRARDNSRRGFNPRVSRHIVTTDTTATETRA